VKIPDIEGKLFLTVDELARICRTDPRTIRRAISAGEIRAHRFGRITRVPVSEVMLLLGVGEPRETASTEDATDHSVAA
jgi:excisionase family DNA binding protein